ncbi:hypothetical protein N7468_005768 [Penicillium chermesinum]|uniref:Uncharacterized protein n=1 Tax=Penicillium chermesinum TaxID=63820 RepID=A0A9W9P296_9EURO|nr:uncharacterized protein N7468_005768 [Penicillium chermesinum]KAJ5232812.1 hypothetical protein N7468_005768 [Penicillium chermesinum]
MGRPHSADRTDHPDGASTHSLHSIDPEDDLPPPYTDDPEVPVIPGPLAAQPPGLVPLQIVDSAYALPDSVNCSSDKHVYSTAPYLSQNSASLFSLALRQIRLPPRPLLYIRGTHTETRHHDNKKESSTVEDFSFKLDLAETLLTGWQDSQSAIGAGWKQVHVIEDEDNLPAYRGGRLRSRTYKFPKSRNTALVADSETGTEAEAETGLLSNEPSDPNSADSVLNITCAGYRADRNLRLWCERFCEDPAPVKSGFDESAMRNPLVSHIRSLNYHGQISCKAVLAQQSVTIFSPHWINRLRANRYIWWIVVILQLWIISWPIIWFLERRYEVAHTTWNAARDAGAENGLVHCYPQGRDPAMLAEYWAPAVKQAAWSRRRGEDNTLTRLDADRLQGLSNNQLLGMDRHDSQAELERRARVDRGEGGFMDSVVGLVRGVGEVHQDWQMAVGWGNNT